MKKFLDAVDRISTGAAVACFVAMALIMTVNIVARFMSGGLPWYMESSQYLNVWCVFIAGVGLCAKNDHLRIDALEGILKGVAKKWLRLVIALFTALFFAMVAAAFFLLAGKSRQLISTMPPLRMAYVYWLIPIMCVLSAAATLLRGIHDFRTFGREEDNIC